MLAFHLMIRTAAGDVLARDTAERRELASTLLRLGEPFGLLALRATGHHGHLVAACTRAEAAVLARAAECALGRRLGRAFEPARIVGVEDQRHLAHAFDYALRNEERHGLEADVAHEASNLPDLVGLRIVGTYTAKNVRERIPTVRRERLLEILGVPSLDPAFDGGILVEAACAAVGRCDLRGREPLAVEARAAAVHVASEALGTGEIGALLRTTPRAVQRLRALPRRPLLERAIRLQMGLRLRLGAALTETTFWAPGAAEAAAGGRP